MKLAAASLLVHRAWYAGSMIPVETEGQNPDLDIPCPWQGPGSPVPPPRRKGTRMAGVRSYPADHRFPGREPQCQELKPGCPARAKARSGEQNPAALRTAGFPGPRLGIFSFQIRRK